MIVSCGEALIDFVPQAGEGSSYRPCLGGSPYNVAIASVRLGVPTGYCGKISRDFFGEKLFDRLSREGVDSRFIRRSNRLSTLAFVQLEQGKEPRYAFYTEGTADASLRPEDVPKSFPDDVACIEFGSISLLMEPQGSTIKEMVQRESGKRVLSFDPNVRPMLIKDKDSYVAEVEHLAAFSSVVKVSSADLEWLYPSRPYIQSAEAWLERGAGVLAVTRGKEGGQILTKNYSVETPEYPVEVKDTIGAGDTFHAALLARLYQMNRLTPKIAGVLSQNEAQDALDYAVKASSLNCAKQGANPPTAVEMAAAL